MDLFWFCIAFFIIDAPITLFSDKGRFDSIALHIRMLVLEEGISDSQEIISFLVLAFPLSLRKIHPPTTIWTLFNPSPRKMSVLHCRTLRGMERIGTAIGSV